LPLLKFQPSYNSRKRERPRSRGRSSIAATHFKVKCVIWWSFQLLGLHSYVDGRKISMEYGRNDTDSGRPKYSRIDLSRCHCVHHQSHMKWARARRRAPVMKDGDWPPHPWDSVVLFMYWCSIKLVTISCTEIFCTSFWYFKSITLIIKISHLKFII